jgi:hypothetical protein
MRNRLLSTASARLRQLSAPRVVLGTRSVARLHGQEHRRPDVSVVGRRRTISVCWQRDPLPRFTTTFD